MIRAIICYAGRAFQRIQKQDLKGAFDDLNQLVLLKPYYNDSYRWRGNLLFRMGDRAGAIKDYNKCIALGSKEAWVFYRRACCLADTGDKLGAISDYKRAVSLDSSYGRRTIPGLVTWCQFDQLNCFMSDIVAASASMRDVATELMHRVVASLFRT